MDVALFFVLPLIGGFAFATQFLLLRYRTGREESQRLYYRAALYGVIFAGAGVFLHHAARAGFPTYNAFIDNVAAGVVLPLLEKERVSQAVPLSQAAARARVELAAVCIYAFILGVLTPLWNQVLRLLDFLWTRMPAATGQGRRSFLSTLNRQAITDHLEGLLADALTAATPIQATLSNSKVYVGSVLESLDPASPAKYFKIQPWMSGHRSSDTGKVDFNTFYDSVLIGLDEEEAKRRAATFQLVIPIDKVVSASGFDFDAYEQFTIENGAVTPDLALQDSPTHVGDPQTRHLGPDRDG